MHDTESIRRLGTVCVLIIIINSSSSIVTIIRCEQGEKL